MNFRSYYLCLLLSGSGRYWHSFQSNKRKATFCRRRWIPHQCCEAHVSVVFIAFYVKEWVLAIRAHCMKEIFLPLCWNITLNRKQHKCSFVMFYWFPFHIVKLPRSEVTHFVSGGNVKRINKIFSIFFSLFFYLYLWNDMKWNFFA